MAKGIANVQPRPDLLISVLEDVPDFLGAFISRLVLPIFMAQVPTAPVPKTLRRARIERIKKGRYGKFTRALTPVTTAGTFDCYEEGHEEPFDDRDIALWGGQDQAEMITGMNALRIHALNKEWGVANTLFNPATFPGQIDAAANPWDDPNGTPIDDIARAMDKVQKRLGVRPNTVTIGGGAYLALQVNPQIQQRIRVIYGYTNPTEGARVHVTPEILASALGVATVLIGDATYDAAAEGQPEDLQRVWSDDYALVHYTAPEGQDMFSPGLGRTFIYDQGQLPKDVVRQSPAPFAGAVMEYYQDAQTNAHVMRARDYSDPLLLNKTAAQLITNI